MRFLVGVTCALALAACAMQDGGGALAPQTAATTPDSKGEQPFEKGVRPLCGPVPAGHFRCLALIRTGLRYDRPPMTDAQLHYGPLQPAQLQQAYNLPSATGGSGQTVGIVDANDDPTAEADMKAYRKAFHLPACTSDNGCFRKLNEAGRTSPLPVADPGWAGEITVDLDMVSAICPNCHIVLIEATTSLTSDLAASVLTARNAGAEQISNSYGGLECKRDYGVFCFSVSIHKYAHDYAIPHTIITAASGDSGWFAGPLSPADYGTVVAVGGTSLYPYNSRRGWFESAWEGAGSGCSFLIDRPSWIPSTTGCAGGMRPIADVSAIADPYPGVITYESYPYTKAGFYVVGGTSVASPIIASVFALAGNASKVHYGYTLYHAPHGALNDVTVGANGIPGTRNYPEQQCVPTAICMSMPGWDGPTGNGTPWGVAAF